MLPISLLGTLINQLTAPLSPCKSDYSDCYAYSSGPRVSILWWLSATWHPKSLLFPLHLNFPIQWQQFLLWVLLYLDIRGTKGSSRMPVVPYQIYFLSIGETSVFWILSVWLSTGLKRQICCNILICLSHWILSLTLNQMGLVLLEDSLWGTFWSMSQPTIQTIRTS